MGACFTKNKGTHGYRSNARNGGASAYQTVVNQSYETPISDYDQNHQESWHEPQLHTQVKPNVQKSYQVRPFVDVKLHYSLGKELGRGQFGVTYLCTEDSSGGLFTCKSIWKRKLVIRNDKEDVKREDGRINYEEFCTMMRSGTKQHTDLVIPVSARTEAFDYLLGLLLVMSDCRRISYSWRR